MRLSSSLRDDRRRRSTWSGLLTVLAAGMLTATKAQENGIIRGEIFSQPRQPMPEHKIRALREARMLDFEGQVPLHAGYGTHFAYLYVGTPAQRVSVIIDTGSHWTAFPCTGCKQCGNDHTDPVFDNEKSTTFHALTCAECKFSSHCSGDKCSVSLSYAEGSRWDAYEARDLLHMGGDSLTATVKGGAELGMPFVFGCQTYETGLFRTQLENGIMGLSNQDLTLVPKLKEAGKIASRVFSLCFTGDGGSLTLGGYDKSRHTGEVAFLPLVKEQGWYTIKLLDVKVGDKSIGVNADDFNKGQGTIVDSGTTDTYMPRSASGAFGRAFREVSGHDYSTRSMNMSPKEFADLPDIVFVFEGGHEERMPWSSYIECTDESSCAGGVFFENPSGAVLGANFMKGRDVVFDAENRRVGFAPANCQFDAAAGATPTAGGHKDDGAGAAAAPVVAAASTDVDCDLTFLEPLGACDAKCPEAGSGVAYGHEPWSMKISKPAQGKGTQCPDPLLTASRPCLVNCTGAATTATVAPKETTSASAAVPASPSKCASSTTWGPCLDTCVQQGTGEASKDGSCTPFKLDRPCSTGSLCPLANKGFAVDFVVVLHGVTGQDHNRGLSAADKQTVLEEISTLLLVPAGDVEVLGSGSHVLTTSQTTGGVPLRLHLTQNSSTVLAEAAGPKSLAPSQRATEVASTLKSESFSLALLAKLKKNGGVFDSLESLELMDSTTQNLDTPPPVGGGGPLSTNDEKISLYFWDVVGGAMAVFLLLMLIIHFRWSHWSTVSQQPASSLLNRVVEPISAKRGSTPKPSSRTYERVRDEEADHARTEDIEMI